MKNKKQKRDPVYNLAEQEAAFHRLQKDVELHKPFHGMFIPAALNYLPDNMLVNIHYQEKTDNRFRNVTVAYAKEHLSQYDKLRRTDHISHDIAYDGIENPPPVCLLEISPVRY